MPWTATLFAGGARFRRTAKLCHERSELDSSAWFAHDAGGFDLRATKKKMQIR